MREKNSGRTMRLLCLGVSTLPVLYLSMFIYRFASPLPVHDQWDVVPFIVSMKEGRPSLSLLVQFHNEHLIVIPRLFFAVLACLFTWDNRLECWVTFVFTVVIFSLLCRVAVKAAAKGERIAYVALIPISLFLFGTNQWQNWLWGFQLAWPIPVLALIASIASLSRSSRLAVRLTIIILATAVAVLSMGNGLLVPLDIIRDSPKAVPCAQERQDVARISCCCRTCRCLSQSAHFAPAAFRDVQFQLRRSAPRGLSSSSEPLPGSFSLDAGSLGRVFGVDYFDIARSSFILRLARLARAQKRGIRLIALLHRACSSLLGNAQQCNDCQRARGTWTWGSRAVTLHLVRRAPAGWPNADECRALAQTSDDAAFRLHLPGLDLHFNRFGSMVALLRAR